MKAPQEGDIVLFMSTHCSVRGSGHATEVIGRVKRDAHGLHAGGKYLETAIGSIEIIARGRQISRKPMRLAETTRIEGDLFKLG